MRKPSETSNVSTILLLRKILWHQTHTSSVLNFNAWKINSSESHIFLAGNMAVFLLLTQTSINQSIVKIDQSIITFKEHILIVLFLSFFLSSLLFSVTPCC